MKPLSFRDRSLVECERELVGACIDHLEAIDVALPALVPDDFRSHEADDLRRIFYTVVGWYANGTFDTATNRERLSAYDDAYVDELWCSHGMFPEYVEALARAITSSNALLDEALAARRRWVFDNPIEAHSFRRMLPPASGALAGQRPKGGFVGGIPI